MTGSTANAVAELAAALSRAHPDEAAALIDGASAAEAALFLASLPAAEGAAILVRLAPGVAAAVIAGLEPSVAAAALATVRPADTAALLRRVDIARRDDILALVPRRIAAAVSTVLLHPPDSAGAIMDPVVLALPADTRVGDALAAVRNAPAQEQDYLYAVDRDRRIRGVLSLLELLRADADAALFAVMRTEVVRLAVDAALAAIVAHPGWDKWNALPVVDSGDRLLGVVARETAQRLARRAKVAAGPNPLALSVSLAELFWLGLTGMLDGFAGLGQRSSSPERKP